jgi:beta-N-acetylhexosaminidase
MHYINSMIAHMSLDEELGQMIMIGFSETQMDDALAYQIQQLHVGSAILYAFNIKSGPQVKQLVSGMQGDATIPLLIATDQEGGAVNRMFSVEGLTPSAAQMGASFTPAQVEQRGAADAQALSQLGINLNLAPVVDVLQTSGGDVQSRTFGSTPDIVTKMAGAYLTGLQKSGQVIGTLKHFPGLGDVPVDPHMTLYTLTRSRADLERIDWAPYRALLATGHVYAVMSTHVIVQAVDPTLPASLSQPVLTGILRDELGFNGVIITDGIYMKALKSFSLNQTAVDAVAAGNDIICSTYSIQSTEQVIYALSQAVASGQIPKSRIDDSVRRILLLKLRLGLISTPNFGLSNGN